MATKRLPTICSGPVLLIHPKRQSAQGKPRPGLLPDKNPAGKNTRNGPDSPLRRPAKKKLDASCRDSLPFKLSGNRLYSLVLTTWYPGEKNGIRRGHCLVNSSCAGRIHTGDYRSVGVAGKKSDGAASTKLILIQKEALAQRTKGTSGAVYTRSVRFILENQVRDECLPPDWLHALKFFVLASLPARLCILLHSKVHCWRKKS